MLQKLNVDIPDQDAVQHEEPSTDEPVLVDQDGRPRAKLLGGHPMHEDAKHARAVRDEVRGEVTLAARPRPRTVTGVVTAPGRAPSGRKLGAREAPSSLIRKSGDAPRAPGAPPRSGAVPGTGSGEVEYRRFDGNCTAASRPRAASAL